MPGSLTIRVLDTSRGVPADGLLVDLFRVGVRPSDRQHLKTAVTNAEGAADTPLLDGDSFGEGCYELLLHVGRYFRGMDVALPDPPFLDVVPVRFGVAAPADALHVGLLIGPWAYSAYHGR
jgi:5-hydroxyisourate hydrolase